MCTIKRDECFGVRGPDGGAPTASQVFKHVAFERTECGDCSECSSPPLTARRPRSNHARLLASHHRARARQRPARPLGGAAPPNAPHAAHRRVGRRERCPSPAARRRLAERPLRAARRDALRARHEHPRVVDAADAALSLRDRCVPPPSPLSTAPQRSLVRPVADLACSLWHQAGHLRSSSGWRRCRRCG